MLRINLFHVPGLLLLMQTANTQCVNLTSQISKTVLSTPTEPSTPRNGTEYAEKTFMYAPLGSSTRLTLFVLLVSVGVIGFVGNVLVLCFLKSKAKTAPFAKAWSFENNCDVYIKSLAISDVLCDVISLPPICIQLYFDIFNQGWSCNIVRYLNIVFTSITMNNLLFFSIERFMITRGIFRHSSHRTVKKMVKFAWLAGFLFTLIPASTFKDIRFDLNQTHYTLVCRYDDSYVPFRIMLLSFTTLQYIIPGCITVIINALLIKTLWANIRGRRLHIQRDNALKIFRRAAAIRGTTIVVTLTLAFVLPYLFYYGQVVYNNVTKSDQRFDFKTDFVIRSGSALIGYSNSAINVTIYIVQMRYFRLYLKKTFQPECFAKKK
ncbi:allatostatin-A receptor-like [Stylophora pistillata]|uniref:allatostatin-A receptor-like n=1 Tax=Stylophora pistillata TaxID=50429 RepID=UPI000C04DAF6|nr:allatostatin-A receptor-like [Stylophora pistillata]